MDEIIYSWKFSNKKVRSSLWYAIVLAFVIGIVIWGFLTKQYGLSFIIMLVAGLFYFIENNSLDEIVVEITNLGFKIGDGFYDFSKIDSYTAIYNVDQAVLLRLNLNKKGLRNVDLIIDNNIMGELNQILPSLLKENPKEDLIFTDRLINLLKL